MDPSSASMSSSAAPEYEHAPRTKRDELLLRNFHEAKEKLLFHVITGPERLAKEDAALACQVAVKMLLRTDTKRGLYALIKTLWDEAGNITSVGRKLPCPCPLAKDGKGGEQCGEIIKGGWIEIRAGLVAHISEAHLGGSPQTVEAGETAFVRKYVDLPESNTPNKFWYAYCPLKDTLRCNISQPFKVDQLERHIRMHYVENALKKCQSTRDLIETNLFKLTIKQTGAYSSLRCPFCNRHFALKDSTWIEDSSTKLGLYFEVHQHIQQHLEDEDMLYKAESLSHYHPRMHTFALERLEHVGRQVDPPRRLPW